MDANGQRLTNLVVPRASGLAGNQQMQVGMVNLEDVVTSKS